MRIVHLLAGGTTALLLVACSPGSPGLSGAPEPEAPAPSASVEAAPEPAVSRARTRRVTLTVGHCFIEPVQVAGRRWVTTRPYVGHGGGLPRGFTPEGRFVVASSGVEAWFVADGGARIRFEVRSDSPPLPACR